MSRTLISQTTNKIGQEVTLEGWAQTKRDHGKVTFIDLRDRTGVIQCIGVGILKDITTESVIRVTGVIKQRSEKTVNIDLATGEIEMEVSEYQILNKADELPILVEGDGREISEEIRLKYRYLDLRRTRMQKVINLRSELIKELRQGLFDQNFVEIETPMLTKSTKEGARDFIVPSRFQPGKFYALPQSPQQYKQLLMTAGFEKYFQVARCIRDEDLRADRGFEFTQLDLEMSFVDDRKQVMEIVEEVVKQAVSKNGGKLKDQQFPIFTYFEAMEKFGQDKFDLRSDQEKQDGILAFAWVIDFPFFKKVDKSDAAEVADSKSGWTFTHNPFSSPIPEHIEWLKNKENIDQIITAQYDLVCNGHEVGGGSIRAHQPELLKAVFEIMGYGDQQIQDSIGHMLEAFTLGTPPHGGIALGLDRLVMLLAGEKSLKETIAFPMTSTGRTAVMDAPSYVDESQLVELGLEIASGKSAHDYILNLLQKSGVSYQYFSHQDVRTSQEAAAVRDRSDLSEGAKALVMQIDKQIILYVVPGDQKADLNKIKKYFSAKRVALVSLDTVKAKTGVEVGGVPPFGSSVGLTTYIDASIMKLEEIIFNCGRRDRSVRIKVADFVRLEKPITIE